MVDYHDTPIKRKIQTTLDGNIAGGDNDSHYADKLQLLKPAGMVRIIAGNPCNLPAHATMDKNKHFFNSIKHLDADVTMIAEHGLVSQPWMRTTTCKPEPPLYCDLPRSQQTITNTSPPALSTKDEAQPL